MEFFQFLFPFLTFDFLPTDLLYESMLKISEQNDEAKSDRFSEVGYGSKLVYGNLGSLPIYQLLFWFVLALFRLSLCSEYTRKSKVGRFMQSQYDKFWWNGQISYWRQNYLAICVSGLISFQNL